MTLFCDAFADCDAQLFNLVLCVKTTAGRVSEAPNHMASEHAENDGYFAKAGFELNELTAGQALKLEWASNEPGQQIE